MLLYTELAKCSDRSIKPKEHATGMGPETWFSETLLTEAKTDGLTFDFFVNWVTRAISPIFWLKLQLKDTYSYDQLLGNLEAEVMKVLPHEKQELISKLSIDFGIQFKLIVFIDSLDWTDESSEILKVKIEKKEEVIRLVPVRIPLSAFKAQIKEYSGGPVQVGQKGLRYGTSRLECALSHTDALYPGDADLILFDEQKEPIAILEYKKHNLNTSIESQQLSNYYPTPDKRKYDRLSILSHFLGQKHPIPIIVIYYPTKPNTTKGKIELLNNRNGNITTLARVTFDITDVRGDNSILSRTLKAVDYYKTKMQR